MIFSLSVYGGEQGDWQGYIGPYKRLFQIQDIKIEGNSRIRREAILEKMDMKVGSIATNYSVRRDIHKLYSAGYFERVEIFQIQRGGKRSLLVKLKEKPVIGKISYHGQDKLDEDDFKEKVKAKPFAILDIAQLREDSLELQKLYEEKGYFLARVDYELISRPRGVTDIVFKIQEYSEVKVKEIQFVGNKSFSDEQLKSLMMTQEKTLFSFMSGSGSFKKLFFQVDQERLKFFYHKEGYLDVYIKKPIITVSRDRNWIFIKIEIREGKPFYVGDISFSGDLPLSSSELLQKVKTKKAQKFNEELMRTDIRNLAEIYQDQGYAFANVNRNMKPSGKTEEGNPIVDLDLSFEKGEIAYFGNISIRGNTNTRDKVIRRELLVHEGMKYSGSKLRISEGNVNRLGFFEPQSVIFKTTPSTGKRNTLDLDITVKERRTGEVNLGAGYSTSTKGFFQASVSQNNFLGLGHYLNASVLFSGNRQTYNLGYTNPYFLDTKWLAGADLFRVLNQRISSFDLQKTGGGLRTGYKLNSFSRILFNYRLENIKLEELYSPEINRKAEEGYASSIQASFLMDKRNNAFEPTQGSYLDLTSQFGGVGGDHKWFKVEAEGRFYYPLGGDFVFRSRLRLGQLYEVGGRKIPRYLRYSMGGPRNMRGFDFEDIGDTYYANSVKSGNLIRFNRGGYSSFLAQLEVERPLVKEAGLKWVVFMDAGNVFKDYIGKAGNFDLRYNWGVGFRWFSPIGILRFEMGFPLGRKDGERANMFHFDIGQLF